MPGRYEFLKFKQRSLNTDGMLKSSVMPTGNSRIFFGTTPPPDPQVNDLWIQTEV